MIIEHHLQGRQQRTVVLQRLAHAHQYHVRDHSLAGAKPAAQIMFGIPELRDDFGGIEISAEALMASRTKTAAHGATGLAGDTQSSAV